MQPTAAAVVVALLATVSAPAGEPPAPWHSVRTGEIEIFTAAGEETALEIAANLQRMRAALGQVSRLNVSAPVATRVFVFRDEEQFRPFARAIFGTEAAKAGAFVSSGDGNYIILDASSRSAAERLAYHELTHFFIRSTWDPIPLCFNEGIADLYSTFSTFRREVFFGRPMTNYLRRLRRQKLIPLGELLRVNEQSSHYVGRVDQGRFYAQSWALVHYLAMTRKDGWDQIGRFLALLRGGVAHEQAFTGAFGLSYDMMERELQQYIRRPMLQSLRYVLDLPPREAPQPRLVPAAEMAAALGDLLLHTPHGRGSARGYLETAMREEAPTAPAKATMALLQRLEGNEADAVRLLREAAAQPMSDEDLRFWPGLRYARSLGRTVQAEDAERVRLSAREAQAAAMQLRHDQEIHRYNEAVSRARNKDLAGAMTILDDLIATAEGETVLQSARELRGEIEKVLKKP